MIQWLPLRGFEDRYEVSNLGEVRSLPHLSIDGRHFKGRLLALIKNANDDYLRVNLNKNGKTSAYLVHRLVAETFIQNPFGKPEVNHKDGNKRNNAAENLEWVTPHENQRHALATGLRGLNCPAHSRQVAVYNLDGSLRRIYPSVAEAHRSTGISLSALYRRCEGQVNQPLLGYVWRYV